MLKQIREDIYLNEITLPNSPLKYLNSYIIKSGGQALVVDTGFNRPECQRDFFAGLAEAGIDLDKTSVLATHLHSDHCGLLTELEQQGAHILLGQDAQAIAALCTVSYWEDMQKFATLYDLDRYNLELDSHPGYKFRPGPINKYRVLAEGDRLAVGARAFQVLFAPGHTLGHIALYEPREGLLFCGDVILDKITPNITFWGFEQDILAVYFSTLFRLRALPVKLLLTGHRALLDDHARRIDELLAHYDRRLAEIWTILERGEQSVSEVASQMTWDIKAKSWEEFPKAQKWFAAGEAMAHLEHFVWQKRARRRQADSILLYAKESGA
jgi:glyoxylase-like metal-dependent hydrolase (beta-lactamase superfamily II)